MPMIRVEKSRHFIDDELFVTKSFQVVQERDSKARKRTSARLTWIDDVLTKGNHGGSTQIER
jgi:hypothetical protein